MSFSIAGKTAVITGAANGCGLAIGRHFLEEGANVVFADIDEAHLSKELGDDIPDDGPMRWFAGDLREHLTVANLLSVTLDAFDRVDILVNASRQIMPSDPLDRDNDHVTELLNQNLIPALRVTQAIAKRMIKQGEGHEDDKSNLGSIINLSSISARRAHPDLLGFSVSAAALDQFTRSMAVALAPHRIRMNGVALGSVMSASLKSVLRDDERQREKIIDHTPLKRIAGPNELTNTVQYLASEASAFVTGQILTVDGGRTLIDPAGCTAH